MNSKRASGHTKTRAFRLSSIALILYLLVCGVALWVAVSNAAAKDHSELLSVLFIALLNISLLLVFELVAIKKVQTPLTKLAHAAERMAEGSYSSKIDIQGDDEIARLGEAFNKLRDIMESSSKSMQGYIDDLQSRVAELRFLTEMNDVILGLDNLDAVFNRITEKVCGLLDGSMCCLVLRDKHDLIHIESLYGFSDAEARSVTRRILDGAFHYTVCPAMATGTLMYASDLAKAEVGDDIKSIYSAIGAKSMMAAPLLVDGQTIGSIIVWYRDPHEFTEMITNRLRLFADQTAILIKSIRMVNNIKTMNLEVVRAFANTIDARDSYTANHSDRVSRFAVALALELGLSAHDIEIIEYAGLLHDLGKVGIKEDILNKPGALTAHERDIMKQHVTISAQIIEPIEFLTDAAPIILHHHEWYNGGGYPDGLAGDEIPIGARILAVADSFEAMTSTRVYRNEMPLSEGVKRLLAGSGEQFDPMVVEAMLEVIHRIEAIEALDSVDENCEKGGSLIDLDPAV